MPQKNDPFINSNYGWEVGENGWGEPLNETILQNAFLHAARINGSATSLPTSPVDGDAYFLSVDKNTYFRVDGVWYFVKTPIGFEFTIKGTEEKVRFDGTSLVPLLSDDEIEDLISDIPRVTSVALTVPTGLSVSGSPITDSGTINISFTTGYSIPTTAKQTSWDAKVATTAIGAANGVAPLDASSKVPSAYLPSYVDDVLEYANLAAFPATGEAGKIYITIDTNRQYRWSGSAYVQIVSSPGTTDNLPEGSTNQYFTQARVRSTPLTGFAAAAGFNAILATDTILQAFNKVQGWLSGLVTVDTTQTISGSKTFTADIVRNAASGQASIYLQQGGTTNGRVFAGGGAGTDVGIEAGRFATLNGVSGSKLAFNGADKLFTTNTGVTVTGDIAATTFTGNGSGLTNLNAAKKTAVVEISTSSHNLDTANESAYHRFTFSGAKTVTVRPNSTHALATDGAWILRNQSASGDLTVTPSVGVTINAPYGGTLVLAPRMTCTLQKVGTDTYDLIGQTVAA